MFSERDDMVDVSASVMLGQLARFGTNAFDLMLDENALQRMPVCHLNAELGIVWFVSYMMLFGRLRTRRGKQVARNPFAITRASASEASIVPGDAVDAVDASYLDEDEAPYNPVSPQYFQPRSPEFDAADDDVGSIYSPDSPDYPASQWGPDDDETVYTPTSPQYG